MSARRHWASLVHFHGHILASKALSTSKRAASLGACQVVKSTCRTIRPMPLHSGILALTKLTRRSTYMTVLSRWLLLPVFDQQTDDVGYIILYRIYYIGCIISPSLAWEIAARGAGSDGSLIYGSAHGAHAGHRTLWTWRGQPCLRQRTVHSSSSSARERKAQAQ
jgi:hypothetical protein